MKYLNLLLFFLLTFSLFSKDKLSILEKMENLDSIPVYFVHGKVYSSKYNAQFGKISLNQKEIETERIHGIFPSEIDSIRDTVMNKLAETLGFNNFVLKTVVTIEGAHDQMKKNNQEIALIVTYRADYSYDYTAGITREKVGNEYVLVSKRKMKGSITVGMYNIHEKNGQLRRLKTTGGFVYDPYRIELKGYVHDANVLMAKRNPMLLKEKLTSETMRYIEKLKGKLDEEHEKVIKKRK